jgi:hypothetical protein
MSSALQAMAFDAGLRQSYSEKSLKRAEMFSWESVATQHEVVFFGAPLAATGTAPEVMPLA